MISNIKFRELRNVDVSDVFMRFFIANEYRFDSRNVHQLLLMYLTIKGLETYANDKTIIK